MPFMLWGFVITWQIIAIAAAVLGLMVIHTIPYWRILQRAGFSGAWSLLRYVPLAGLVLLWVFAFAPWPVEGRKA